MQDLKLLHDAVLNGDAKTAKAVTEAALAAGVAIDLHVTLLPPVALDLGHGHAVNADASEGVAHLVELERFDDGDDQFHGFPSRQSLWLALDLFRKPVPTLDRSEEHTSELQSLR